MPTIEGRARELLEAKNFCHVATIRKDGTPHVIPVWVDTDGEHVVLNSAEGRLWVRNAERDPRITCTVTNHDDPYQYVTVKGRVEKTTLEDGKAVIDMLAKKYLDKDEYPWLKEGEQRITYRVRPEKVKLHG